MLYLGWGNRFYGKHPITPGLHEGWTYMVILEGQPRLWTDAGAGRKGPGSLVLIGPDVAHGWEDDADGRASMLSWVWREGPDPPGTGREPRKVLRTVCGKRRALAEAEAIHRESRAEVHRSDAFSGSVLAACKLRLEALFQRAASAGEDTASRDTQRMRLAGEWMRRHLDARAPAAGMADYLGISAAELHLLFRARAGDSPGRVFHAFKMREARERLRAGGVSVKAVGFDFGYRNAGDFTRAYARYHGHPPSADLRG